MTHELVLTSVSQGLDGGTGFCPVAEDRALPNFLRNRLEAFSIYSHFFEPDSEEASLQPTAYSHHFVSGEEQTYHILSRLAPTGTDYRHKPNSLAHHVVLRADELVSEGPAWVCGLPNFHLTEWITPAVRFAKGRTIPTLTSPPAMIRRQLIARHRSWLDPKKLNYTQGELDADTQQAFYQSNQEQILMSKPPTCPCPCWQEATGDAGWAGVLADTAVTGQAATLLFRPGQNLLPLFIEALALLPQKLLWKVSFSTYFTGSIDDVVCQWKGVLFDSLSATLIQQDRSQLLIDLTQPLGGVEHVPVVSYIGFARSGADHDLPHDEDNDADAATDYHIKDKDYGTKDYENPPSSIKKTTPPKPFTYNTANTVSIEHRTPQSASWMEKILTTNNRFLFYLLYGITLALIVFLFVLVADQTMNLNLLRSPTGVPNKKMPVELGSVIPKNDPVEENPVEEKFVSNIEELLPKPPEKKIELSVPTNKDIETLIEFLKHWNAPPYLPMPIPRVDDKGTASLPQEKTLKELAELSPYAIRDTALKLEFSPLIPLKDYPIKTRRETTEGAKWTVYSPNDNGTEVQLFHFVLTKDGLTISWNDEGMQPQNFNETILSSLGFLCVSVNGKPETVKAIPMFEPKHESTLILKDFSEKDKTIPTPFAEEPWDTLLKEKLIDGLYSVELVVAPVSETLKIIPKTKEAAKYIVEFDTRQEAIQEDSNEKETFVPIVMSIEATLTTDKLVWKDLFLKEKSKLESERNTLEEEVKNNKIDYEKTRTDVFLGSTDSQKKELGLLKEAEENLKRRHKNLKERLEKLNEAHTEFVDADITFDYEVYLVPKDKSGRNLLIMKSDKKPVAKP